MSRFRTSAQLRFRDADMYGHVNNAVHLTIFENARVLFYQEITPEGTTFEETVGAPNFVLVSNQRIEYSAPLLVSLGSVEVELWVSRVGASSFDLSYEMSDGSTHTLYARATTGLVQVSRETGKAVPLTAEQRAHLDLYAGSSIAYRS